MRIVIVGDFQLENTPTLVTQCAMEDIKRLEPDLVIAMGDFGDNAHIGTPEGLSQAAAFLNSTGARVLPLLGNHDLQREIGQNQLDHGTMEYALCDLFGVQDSFFTEEYDDFRIIGVSLDSWDQEPPYSPNECHIGDDRFSWLEAKLNERPGVPVILCTHAPPMGCGLRTVPYVHVRATNAYMDQNTLPLRWIALTEHPEIVLWFCAHYHLGHDHLGALIERQGVVYVTTGVHGCVSRDGTHHTRALEVKNKHAYLHTLDHDGRQLRSTPDWESIGSLTEHVKQRKLLPMRVMPPSEPHCMEELGPLGKGGIQTLPNGHLLLASQDDFLWEIDPKWDVVLGTLHYKEGTLDGYVYCNNRVWRCFGKTLASVDVNDPWRFSREEKNDHRRDERWVLPAPARKIVASVDAVYVLCSDQWYRVSTDTKHGQLQICINGAEPTCAH